MWSLYTYRVFVVFIKYSKHSLYSRVLVQDSKHKDRDTASANFCQKLCTPLNLICVELIGTKLFVKLRRAKSIIPGP